MIADILLVAGLILFTILGKKRGLFSCLAGILSFALSLILVWLFSKPLTDLATKTPLYDSVLGYVTENSAVAGAAADGLAELIIKIIVFIAITILAKVVIKLLNKVFKLPVLRTFNKLGGLVLGLICGFAVAYTVLAVWGSMTLFVLPKELETSYLTKLMFENNILLIFFK